MALLTGALLPDGPALARDKAPPPPATGPAADYPIVLGAPFVVDGVTYTPVDVMNYDQVGYALIDPAGGDRISLAHRTLPLPSYVEVTSLRTGKTILVRAERRGPMTGAGLVALSPAAAAQLGTSEARTPIRIRRVNPAEPERALLRAGQRAADRMDTPMSLVGVLMRKLEPAGQPPAPAAAPTTAAVAAPAPASAAKRPAVMPPSLKPAAAAAIPPAPKPATQLAPQPVVKPVVPMAPPIARPVASAAPVSSGPFVVQVGAYSSRTNAAAVAARVGGGVSPAGRLFRVRISGLTSQAQASAALAKVRAAGYTQARIQRAD
ncbi:SPOR domain-containing protein [Novosphingobium piscinae]|uniref:SPOR domain-containing protein n=1 Tax=Novosphingobium piscinae TaxID=1507448 RepID=A0A7X1FYR5_9SPHN|nr:SPOR domain-containing protein [Novosphingobium piscinae]MBC2669470.1 SPOR domain-containing protein [Novosphingobium piscinae]